MKIALWVAQILLAATLAWASYMKFFTPAGELAAMWPWTAANPALVKITAVFDLLGAIGLLIPKLAKYAAYGVIALMLSAIVFHISRGEVSQTGFNVFVIAVAGFIAWGRSRVAS